MTCRQRHLLRNARAVGDVGCDYSASSERVHVAGVTDCGCSQGRSLHFAPDDPAPHPSQQTEDERWTRHVPPADPPRGWMPLHPCHCYALPIGLRDAPPISWSTYHEPHDRDDETRASTHSEPYLDRGEPKAVTRHAYVALVGWKNPRRTATPGHGPHRDNARSRSESKGSCAGKPSADRSDGGCWRLQAAHCLC